MNPPLDPPLPGGDALWRADMLALTERFGRLAVYERDLRTGRARWSASMFSMFDLPPGGEPPTVDVVASKVLPDDRDRVLGEFLRADKAPGDYELRFRVLRPDGGLRHLHSRWQVTVDEQGTPLRLAGVMIDDTESVEHQRQGEIAAARERERAHRLAHRMDLITQAAGVGVWTVDIETDRLEWSDQMYRIYGVGHGEQPPTLAALIARHVHPDDKWLIPAQRRRAAAPGQGNLHFVFRIVRPDGQVRSLSSWSRREISETGRLTGYGVTMDVTEQQRAQERLRDLDESALLAAESAGIGTWEIDPATQESMWNAQMFRLRGYAPDCGLTPREVREATHLPDDQVELRAKVVSAVAGGEDYEHEFRVRWPDGSIHWLASRGITKRDGLGRVTRLLGVNWDVTEHKRAQEALRDKESAERANHAKSEFLSRMSHELRTPLNAVLGFTQLLLQDAGADEGAERRRQRLQQVDSAGRHLLSLIDDVLDVASVEAQALKLELKAVSLHAAFADACQWTADQADQAGVLVSAAPTEAWVMGDERRLRQIVANLLSNAIKYNRRGGGVWLEVHPSTIEGGPAWEIRVRDNGRGLSEQQQAHLFEPFNRLGAERESIPGTGIGLTIVRHIVQQMGGSMAVASEAGRGSEFSVRLPRAQAADAAPSPVEAAPARQALEAEGTGALDLLYIEDNPVNTLLVEELVALRPRLRLRTAIDGATGIAMAASRAPDLVLIDMQLPDIDGLEVMLRLRALPAMAVSRFVALSAGAMADDIQRALAAGFDDYWTKPIDTRAFLAALDAIAAQCEAATARA